MLIDAEAANEAIFSARSSGRSIVAIAREFGRSEDEVRSVVAQQVERTFDGQALREAIALENQRLLALSLKYYGLAMGDEGDHQAAVIYVKTSERRMAMLGGNAPAQYSVHLSHAVAPAVTSTDRLRAALDRLDGKAAPPAEEEDAGDGSEPVRH
jgi:hypothetical protein